jgi:uncharacterized SAM-binding protein YcdF (DUF218 family)
MPTPLFLLKKILSALILPPTGLILLGFIGLWLAKKHPKAGKTITALSLTTLLILSLPITGNALMHSLEQAPPITQAQIKDIQAIVILGGGKNNNAPEYGGIDTINKWTLERLRYGAHLQKQTGKPILVTGGAPYSGRPEADAMAETLKEDFHAITIWIEDRSNDTAENAAYSAKILKGHGITKIALVSQAWHLSRAKTLFEKQGLTVTLAGTGYTSAEQNPVAQWLPEASALLKSSMAIKEYLGSMATR